MTLGIKYDIFVYYCRRPARGLHCFTPKIEGIYRPQPPPPAGGFQGGRPPFRRTNCKQTLGATRAAAPNEVSIGSHPKLKEYLGPQPPSRFRAAAAVPNEASIASHPNLKENLGPQPPFRYTAAATLPF